MGINLGCIDCSGGEKTFIVTGSNKGLGQGIVENLCQRESIPRIIMACRNKERGDEACKILLEKYLDAENKLFVEIVDLADETSIDEFVETIKSKYKTFDCLVNNAGILIKHERITKDTIEQCKQVAQVNYYGTVDLTRKLLPLLNNHGKIATVASGAGSNFIANCSEEMKKRFTSEDMTEEKAYEFQYEFLKAVEEDNIEDKGFPRRDVFETKPFCLSYGCPKACMLVFMKAFSKQEDIQEKDIQVFSYCPGYTKTDMTGQDENAISVVEGIKQLMELLEEPWTIDVKTQGQFFKGGKNWGLVDEDPNRVLGLKQEALEKKGE